MVETLQVLVLRMREKKWFFPAVLSWKNIFMSHNLFRQNYSGVMFQRIKFGKIEGRKGIGSKNKILAAQIKHNGMRINKS